MLAINDQSQQTGWLTSRITRDRMNKKNTRIKRSVNEWMNEWMDEWMNEIQDKIEMQEMWGWRAGRMMLFIIDDSDLKLNNSFILCLSNQCYFPILHQVSREEGILLFCRNLDWIWGQKSLFIQNSSLHHKVCLFWCRTLEWNVFIQRNNLLPSLDD